MYKLPLPVQVGLKKKQPTKKSIRPGAISGGICSLAVGTNLEEENKASVNAQSSIIICQQYDQVCTVGHPRACRAGVCGGGT